MQSNNQLRVSLLALAVLAAFGANSAMAADAISDSTPTIATSLNTNPSGGATAVGNESGDTTVTGSTVTITGDTTVSGTLTANGGILTQNADIDAGAGVISTTGHMEAGTLTTSGLAALESANVTNDLAVTGTTSLATTTTGAFQSLVPGLGSGSEIRADGTSVAVTQNGHGLSIEGDVVELTSGANSLVVDATTGTTVTGNLTATSNAYLGGPTGSPTLAITPTSVSVRNGATIDMGGNRVSGVANGVAATDAVNKRQLDELRDTVVDNQKEARRGIAGVAAIAGIPALEAGRQFNFGVGVGNYKNESALAIGAHARINQDLTAKLAVGVAGGDTAISAGLGYSF